jgi:hypothetical protein
MLTAATFRSVAAFILNARLAVYRVSAGRPTGCVPSDKLFFYFLKLITGNAFAL